MQFDTADSRINYIGDDGPRGSYVLAIEVRENRTMSFGGFKQGKLIEVQSGQYLYVGSALAEKGSTCLARRLVRHATRTGDQEPHPIRDLMLREFPHVGLVHGEFHAPVGKTLRWNIDHLLDIPVSDLVSAYVVRCPLKLEPEIGDLLETDPHTVVFEKGLGANDRAGSTYLLRVEAGEDWWDGLSDRLNSLYQTSISMLT